MSTWCISTVPEVSVFFSIPFLKYLLIHLLCWILVSIKLFSQSCYKLRSCLLVPIFTLETKLRDYHWMHVKKRKIFFYRWITFPLNLSSLCLSYDGCSMEMIIKKQSSIFMPGLVPGCTGKISFPDLYK